MTVNNQNSSNNNKQLCVKQNQNQRKDNKIKRVDEQINTPRFDYSVRQKMNGGETHL